ncbi:MAG: hypothetical protein HQK73_06770 [Desulfamplus sp.]|nr:hypothetical protein [Desulfamplus sp.]
MNVNGTEEAEIRTVKDTTEREYRFISKLGEGGQGTIWKTQFEGFLVKLANKKIAENRKGYYSRLKYIMDRVDLPAESFAKPQALLQEPDCGYVMELMTDMKPLSELMMPPPESENNIIEWYKKDGAIKRRYTLLKKLAKIIMDIHSVGFSYGDISPYNIFVSSDPEHHEVQLIDCDNLTIARNINGEILYTPKYAAPELISKQGSHNTLTDAWSFAVIAYQLITLKHPLLGDMVNNGEPELEEKALAGDIPWIEDETDKNNICSDNIGLRSSLVIFKSVMELFQQTFGEQKSVWKRPGMQEWYEKLKKIDFRFLKCDECEEYFLPRKEMKCRFCETIKTENYVVILKFVRWEPEAEEGTRITRSKELGLPKIMLNRGDYITIDSILSHIKNFKLEIKYIKETDKIQFHLTEGENKSIFIRLKRENFDDIDTQKEHETELVKGTKKSIKSWNPNGKEKEYLIHFGELTEPHRMITFKWQS